jgi:hypothetical protein
MADKAFTALIVPISGSGARPDQSLPGAQPHPDNTLPGGLPRPEHPIYYPLPPGGVIDNTLPGAQPHPDQGLPGSQPKPDQGLPGSQPGIDNTLPPPGEWLPVYIWGPTDPRPGTGLPGSQPKPDQGLPVPPPTDEEKAKVEWKAMWTPTTGWVSFAVVVPGKPVPTPSSKR